MKYKVIKRYLDSNLKQTLNVGDEIELTDKARARQLQGAGIIDEGEPEAPKPKKRRGRPKSNDKGVKG